MALERFMVSKEYMGTARTLLRIAKDMTDQAMADRLKTLADDYERRGRRADLAESAKALTSLARRGAESRPRAARSS
jgi:hypothetical protein